MKKVFYAVMLLLSLSIMASCEKEEQEAKDTYDITGTWVLTDDSEITYYYEFTKNGIVNYYELLPPKEYEDILDFDTPAYFENGTLYLPSSFEWGLIVSGEYSVENGHVYYDGTSIGSITKKDKDTYLFVSAILPDGTAQRVKKFDSFSIIGGKSTLEGKNWKPLQVEYRLKGRPVECHAIHEPITYHFSNGVLQVDSDGERVLINYTFNNDSIEFDDQFPMSFKVLKLTQNTLISLQSYKNKSITPDIEKKKEYYATFNGVEFYSATDNNGYWHCWYYNGNNPIECDEYSTKRFADSMIITWIR